MVEGRKGCNSCKKALPPLKGCNSCKKAFPPLDLLLWESNFTGLPRCRVESSRPYLFLAYYLFLKCCRSLDRHRCFKFGDILITDGGLICLSYMTVFKCYQNEAFLSEGVLQGACPSKSIRQNSACNFVMEYIYIISRFIYFDNYQ